MLAKLQAFLAPPVFPDDEEKTRKARLLNVILLAVIGLVLFFSVLASFTAPEVDRFVIEIVIGAWAVFILFLLRRGYVHRAGFLFTLTLWLVVTYGTYEEGGFRGSIMSSYFGILVIAEMLLGVWVGVLFGFLSVVFAGWTVMADSQGLMPPAPDYATLTTFWGEFTATVVGVVLLLSLIMNNLERALHRSRRNERELEAKVKEVQILARRAREANEFKTRLIARISHEVRTPLGALVGMSEMLQQDIYGPLTPQQRDITDRIIRNAQMLERVFAELLDQSQIELGQLRIRRERFSPVLVAEGVHENLLPQAQQKGIELVLDVASDAPKVVVGDSKRVEQILTNLVVNAIKFTENGRITIIISRKDHENWLLQVQDTGIGISDEDQAVIFDPFRQADESIGRKFGGVGLGLSIVKQLAEAMGGTVNLESELGKGSIFTVTLPIDVKEETVYANETAGVYH
ncbi:MAG: hypothetical protein D6706_13100 [Chloroflexi bacterium]|nr:MAG: hypothetical protein D6706_13100 [Chloroflexota bacterium]